MDAVRHTKVHIRGEQEAFENGTCDKFVCAMPTENFLYEIYVSQTQEVTDEDIMDGAEEEQEPALALALEGSDAESDGGVVESIVSPTVLLNEGGDYFLGQAGDPIEDVRSVLARVRCE